MVDPELYGSLQVLHFSEPPVIMDLAASAVKAGSCSQFNFKVLSSGVRDAPHDGRGNGTGEGFYLLDGGAEQQGGGRLGTKGKRGEAALSSVAMQDQYATATSAAGHPPG